MDNNISLSLGCLIGYRDISEDWEACQLLNIIAALNLISEHLQDEKYDERHKQTQSGCNAHHLLLLL